ncbi:hypothetical protein [Caballeronia calidae]|uniref:hypothetical protein n=1 Tax=Caballeronia calidae TaxID=1777139 RepID=UPI0018DF2A19|nr:hypothetical protein [Caballeronia calidae]
MTLLWACAAALNANNAADANKTFFIISSKPCQKIEVVVAACDAMRGHRAETVIEERTRAAGRRVGIPRIFDRILK